MNKRFAVIIGLLFLAASCLVVMPPTEKGAFTLLSADEFDTPATPTPTPVRTPNVVLVEPMYVRKLTAGKRTYVEVKFTNVGNWAATQVLVMPEPNSNLSLSIGDGEHKTSTLYANRSLEFTLYISADSTVKTGTYEVKLTCTYFDATETLQTKTSSLHVSVINEEEEEKKTPPGVSLTNISGGSADAGSTTTVSATVTAADAEAKGVSVAVGGLSSDKISLPGGAGSFWFDTLAVDDPKTVSFTLGAAEKMETGSYPITLKLTYHDADGTEYSSEYTYYVYVTGMPEDEEDESRAIITADVVAPVGWFDTAQQFTVKLTLSNTGEKPATNIIVSEECPEGVVPNSASKLMVVSLAPGGARELSFIASPTAASATQSYTIGFTIEYETGKETTADTKDKHSFSQYASVSIVNSKADAEAEKEKEEDEDKNKSVPKIIVSRYSVDPIIVEAGQEFDLYLTFRNTHRIKSVENIKASLTVPVNSEGTKTVNVFSPVDASNTFYIDSIPPRGESEQHIRLYTVPDAQVKNYVLILSFEYEDADGSQITSESEVGVNVKQHAKLELGDYMIPPSANVGESMYVEFTVQNTGKVNLNNLKVKMTGEGFDTSGSEVIYGNFTPGNHEYYNGTFTPIASGVQVLKLIVSYDEDTGEHVEDVREYDIEVMDFGGDFGMDGGGEWGGDLIDGGMSETEGGNFFADNWLWLTLGGGVIVVAVIVIIGINVRRSRLKGMDLDA